MIRIPGPAGRRAFRRSFTLVELLVVVAVIALLASMTLVVLYQTREDARRRRTESIIARINAIVMERWESYRTRPVPLRLPPNLPPHPRAAGSGPYASYRWEDSIAFRRLHALRELMRLELPDRKTDVLDGPVSGIPAPALWLAYRRLATAQLRAKTGNMTGNLDDLAVAWSEQYQGAECLYLILAAWRRDEVTGLDFLSPSEIGDFDNDGMFEVLDAWGKPIEWIRWPAGFESDLQRRGAAPDPFDPLKADPRWWLDADPTNDPYAIYPLIYSPGPDGVYDIVSDFGPALHYSKPFPGALPNDPYITQSDGSQIGQIRDLRSPGSHEDNITNHHLEVR